jgi:DNA polymerase sigma
MRTLSSFIHKNYASPNIKDIEYARRRREIEEIDEIVQRKKQDSSVYGRDVGEIIELH